MSAITSLDQIAGQQAQIHRCGDSSLSASNPYNLLLLPRFRQEHVMARTATGSRFWERQLRAHVALPSHHENAPLRGYPETFALAKE
jgi:hypothetical protein